MAKSLLIDADVLIDYTRAYPNAVAFIEALTEPFLLSAITVAELYAGVRDGRERGLLDELIDSVEVLAVDVTLAVEGGLLRREYLPSHGVDLPDAVIAASAEANDLQVATLNERHFPMLDDVIVPYRKN